MEQKTAGSNSTNFFAANWDSPNSDLSNLSGMSAAAAKQYILGFVTSSKLTEKKIRSLEEEAAKWKGRVELARSRGMDDLAAEAEREAAGINAKLAGLREEALALRERIAVMRSQLPGLAARERSVDADILERELLMLLGYAESGATEALKLKINGNLP